ncbi:MAG: sulfotransferase [Flavobacteriales bacterium]|nr:sulfotransferase [Flavobacteriales bacterium]MBL6873683.1 sulfotransferase [Flavobacteriales bacterium]
MMKVNTFIVGAPKAGTTSLHFYLSKHAKVSMSTVKEPNFFSSKEVSSLYYNSKSIESTKNYHNLFAEDKKIMGEASVSYLFYEDVPKRIYDYNKNAKIIIMLRSPVERALSHYLMDCRLGFCNVSFEDIISNKEKYPKFFQQFIELGLYHAQLERYLSTFGKDKVKIIFYSDFKNNTAQVMEELVDFLEIEKLDTDFTVQNPFLSPSSTIISFLYKYNWVRKSVKFLLSKKNLDRLRKAVFLKKSKPVFSDELKSKIRLHYLTDIEKIESMLEVDLSRWKKE